MGRIQVRPGKGGAWVGIITGTFFLVFGVVFLTLVMDTEDTPGQTTPGQTPDFGVRLRTLEKLKADGLIIEQEYRIRISGQAV